MLGAGQAWCLPEPPVCFTLSWGRGLAHFPPGTVVSWAWSRGLQGAQAVPAPKDCGWLQALGSPGHGSVMVQQSQEQQVWFSDDAKLLQCMLPCSVTFDSVTPWTVIYQAPPSLEFPRQELWIRLPFPSPGGIFPAQGSNLHLLNLAGRFFTPVPPGKPCKAAALSFFSSGAGVG